LAFQISFLLGKQAMFGQAPPIHCRSSAAQDDEIEVFAFVHGVSP